MGFIVLSEYVYWCLSSSMENPLPLSLQILPLHPFPLFAPTTQIRYMVELLSDSLLSLFVFSLQYSDFFFSNLPSSNSALIYFSIIKVLFLFKICMVIGNLLLLTKTLHYLFYCLKIYLPIWLFNVFAGLIRLFAFVELLYVGIHAYKIIFNWTVSMGTFWDLGRGISPKEKKPLSGAWGHYPTYDHFEINCHFLKHIINVTSSPKFMLGPLNGWDSHRWLLLFLGLHPW